MRVIESHPALLEVHALLHEDMTFCRISYLNPMYPRTLHITFTVADALCTNFVTNRLLSFRTLQIE